MATEVPDASTTSGPGPDVGCWAARHRLRVVRVGGTQRPDRVRDANVGPRIHVLDGVHGLDVLHGPDVLRVLDVFDVGGYRDR